MVSPYYSNLDRWQLSFHSSGKTLCAIEEMVMCSNFLLYLIPSPKNSEWHLAQSQKCYSHWFCLSWVTFFSSQNLYPQKSQDQALKSMPMSLDPLFESGSLSIWCLFKISTDYNYVLFWGHFLILTPLSLYDFINRIMVCFWLSSQTLLRESQTRAAYFCPLLGGSFPSPFSLCVCSGLSAAWCFDVSLH